MRSRFTPQTASITTITEASTQAATTNRMEKKIRMPAHLNNEFSGSRMMHASLNTGARKITFMLVCLAAAGSYTASVARHYVAYRLTTNADPGSLGRAAG